MIFGTRKVQSLGYRVVKKIAEKFNRLSRVHQRHRQTDRRQTTDGRPIAYSERNVVRSLKMELVLETIIYINGQCSDSDEFTVGLSTVDSAVSVVDRWHVRRLWRLWLTRRLRGSCDYFHRLCCEYAHTTTTTTGAFALRHADIWTKRQFLAVCLRYSVGRPHRTPVPCLL